MLLPWHGSQSLFVKRIADAASESGGVLVPGPDGTGTITFGRNAQVASLASLRRHVASVAFTDFASTSDWPATQRNTVTLTSSLIEIGVRTERPDVAKAALARQGV